MRVRLAIASDEADIVAMVAAASPECFPELTFSPVRTRASFRKALEDHMPVFFVAETEQNQVVGFQVLVWGNSLFSTSINVEQQAIYVRPEFRAKGAVVAMLLNLEAFAARVGADIICANVSSGHRAAATERLVRRFGYHSLGAVLQKRRQT